MSQTTLTPAPAQTAARRTRVLFVDTSEYFGSVMGVHRQIIKFLDTHNHQLFAIANKWGESAEKYRAISGVSTRVYNLGESFQNRDSVWPIVRAFFSSLMLILSLARIIWAVRRDNIDVVYCAAQPRSLILSMFISFLGRAKLVVHVHHVEYRSVNRLFVSLGLRRADAIVAVSNFIKRTLVGWGIDGSKIFAILNVVDLHKFNPDVDGSRIRREFGLDSSTPLLAVVGRINRQKGQMDLAEALITVKKEFPDVKVLLVGWIDPKRTASGGTYFDDICEFSNRNKLTENIIFAGGRTDVPNIFAAADIVVVPSKWDEPFGLVVAEGMASGRPVVGTLSGGIPEIITEDTGILVPKGDPDQLADAIIQLLKDPQLRETLGNNARKRTEELFYESRLAAEVARVYITLVSHQD